MANNGQGKDTLQKLLEDCGITNEEVQLDVQQEHDQDEAEALPLQPLPATLNAPAEYFTVQTGTTGQHSAHIMGQRAVLSQIPGDRSKNVIPFANNVTTGLVASKPHVNQRVPTLITLQSSNGGSAPVNQKLIITQVSKPVATTTRTLYLTPTTKLLTSSGSNGQPGSSTATLGGSPVVLGASSMQVQQVNSQQKMNSYVLPGQGIVLQPKSQMPLSVPLTNQAVRAGSSGAQKPTVCLPKPGSSNVLLPKKFRLIGPGTHVITPATVTGLGGAAGDLKRIVVKAPQATALSLLSKQRTVPGIVLNAARLPGAEVKTVSPSPSPGLSHSNMRSSVSWDGSRSLSNSPVLSLGNIPAHVTQSAASARNSPAASARNSPAASARNSPAASGSGSTGNPMKDEGMVMRAFKNSKMNSQARDELAEAVEEESEELGHAETYADYKPRKVESGLKHPDQVVESSSLASVEPPDVFYRLAIPESVMDSGLLSSLQLEAITYACQRHESLLHNKERAGYFIGDGAGVGKGRTVAGIIHENYILGRKRALWLSVSNDLKVDAERDLCDIGASNIKVYSLNKFKYAKISSPENGSVKKGVLFLTYSSLIGESSQSQSKYRTRLKQIIKWFGKNFDGAIIFDECHKAKNLCPTGSGKPTKTGSAVLELQNRLPNARVVYASATGATEPKNMAYMTRLGMWGPGTPFGTFTDFINCLEKRGVGAMELVAMEMKLSGMYIARQLSFKGVSFKILESHMDEDFKKVYDDATLLWMEAKSMFQKASELNRADSHARKSMWAQFWATHQRFFKHMCISGKVDHCVQLAQDAVADGKCVVIGLQSTGEARTQELVDQEGSDMVDFFSTCKGLFTNLVEKHFPAADPSKTFDLLSRGFCGTNSGFKRKSEDILGSSSKRAKQEEEKMDTDSGSDSESDSDSDLDSAEDFLDSADDSDYERDYDSHPIQWFDGGSDSDDSLDDDETSRGKASIKGKGKGKKSKKSEKKKKKKKRTSDDEADDFCDKKLASIANLKKSNTFSAFDSNSIKDDPNNENGMFRALQIKKELMKRIEELPLPHNTLDSLVDKLGGPQNVAEMTGRKGRVVQNEDGVQYESRSEEEVSLEYLNLKEKERFMNGEKNIAIISEAASSGISLHADRRAVNQKRRVHITLELPWSADRAIQQFGRTHRSNQVSAPEYVFLISDLAGERRFASTVAKRLESLGALTHGDRRATESRDLSRFNIDNRFGRQALETVMKSVVQLADPIVDSPAGYTKEKFFYEVKDALEGVGLITICDRETRAATLEKDYTNISKFLNRLLGIPTDLQNALFEYFSNTLAAIILDAKRSGRWDMGILDVGSGQEVVKKLETKVFVGKSATNSARTELSTIQVERGMPWDRALKIWQKCNAQEEGFYTSTQERNGKRTAALVVRQGSNKKKEKVYSLHRPNTGLQARAETMEEIKKKYKKVLPGDAEEWWQKQYEVSASICIHAYWNGNCRKVSQGLPCEIGLRTRQYHVLSGSVLSVWSSVEAVMSSMPGGTSSKMQVVRLRASADEKIVGSLIPPSCVAPLVNVLSSRSSETLVLNCTLQGAVNSLNNGLPPFNSSASSSSAVASSSSSYPSSSTHNGPTQRSNGVGDGGDHSQEAAEVPPPPRQTELLSMPTLI